MTKVLRLPARTPSPGCGPSTERARIAIPLGSLVIGSERKVADYSNARNRVKVISGRKKGFLLDLKIYLSGMLKGISRFLAKAAPAVESAQTHRDESSID
jgi:hypothetical protein